MSVSISMFKKIGQTDLVLTVCKHSYQSDSFHFSIFFSKRRGEGQTHIKKTAELVFWGIPRYELWIIMSKTTFMQIVSIDSPGKFRSAQFMDDADD